jgi:hypothetical protein
MPFKRSSPEDKILRKEIVEQMKKLYKNGKLTDSDLNKYVNSCRISTWEMLNIQMDF